jgi:hypothetical protein
MSANPSDVRLSHGHTRIAQTELPRQSPWARLANLTNHNTSSHDSAVLQRGKMGTRDERSCAIDLLAQELYESGRRLRLVLRRHT